MNEIDVFLKETGWDCLNLCCDKFVHALEEDTDTEGFRLISWWHDRFEIGPAASADLMNFDYCPWCGKQVDHSQAALMPK